MSESKLPEGMREQHSREIVMVYGIDVRELDREDLLAVIGLLMEQDRRQRKDHMRDLDMLGLGRYRARACV